MFCIFELIKKPKCVISLFKIKDTTNGIFCEDELINYRRQQRKVCFENYLTPPMASFVLFLIERSVYRCGDGTLVASKKKSDCLSLYSYTLETETET